MPRLKNTMSFEEKKQEAFRFFVEKGYTPAQAAGIVGNLIAESSLNTTIKGDKNTSDYAVGLAQWRLDRKDNLRRRYGDGWTDFYNQLDFVDWELKNTEKKAYRELQKATTPDQAALVISQYYERPHKDYAHNDRRKAHALKLYQAQDQNIYSTDSKGQIVTVSPEYATPQQIQQSEMVKNQFYNNYLTNLGIPTEITTFANDNDFVVTEDEATGTTIINNYYETPKEEVKEEKPEVSEAQKRLQAKKAERQFLVDLVSSGAFDLQAPQYNRTSIMKDGGKVRIIDYDGNEREIATNSKEYRDMYEAGDIVLKEGEDEYKTSLPEVIISKNHNKYPFFDKLSPQEKEYIDDDSPIGRQIRARATDGVGFNADKAAKIPGQILQGAGSALQVPQSMMVEGIEALRGNEYDFKSAWIGNDQRLPSDAWGYENPEGFWQNAANLSMDVVVDPTLVTGAGAVGRNIVKKGARNTGKHLTTPANKIIKESVQPVQPITRPWQLEELPGLHLKSTMEGEAISRIVDKTGKINTEQALAIIGKESGGADKVALIRQGLGENIPKKMDYNEFRKTVQDQLIPLHKKIVDYRSEYGLDRLGYANLEDIVRDAQGNAIRKKYNVGEKPLENQTLILGNKSKFGRGSSAHGNPEETLGHAHFLRDAETPDVLTVTQIQSDAFQGGNHYLNNVKSKLENHKKLLDESLKDVEAIKDFGAEDYERMIINPRKKWIDEGEKELVEAMGSNPIQKQLLDKNHQERYLQELVDYAGKRGDVNKVRVPTSETAAKVQGYSKHNPMSSHWDYSRYPEELNNLRRNVINASKENYDDAVKQLNSYIEKNKPNFLYSSEHQTILKKYAEQPKTIKKLFGVEPKIVTDSKGNTWYEFDIPEKFKQGKGEIKAFNWAIPAAIATGAAATSGESEPQQYKTGGQITPEAAEEIYIKYLQFLKDRNENK